MESLDQKTILKTPIISRKGQPAKADPADTLLAFPTIARVYNLVTANANETLSLATSLATSLTASLALPEYIAGVMP